MANRIPSKGPDQRLLFLSCGVTGAGHVVLGLSIGNALRRAGYPCSQTQNANVTYQLLLPDIPASRLCEREGFAWHAMPFESPTAMYTDGGRASKLLETILRFHPDILIVDLFWFAVQAMIPVLHAEGCRCFFLSRQVHPRFFEGVPGPIAQYPDGIRRDLSIVFDPQVWDKCFAIEPYDAPPGFTSINPLIICNHNEVLPRKEALNVLGCNGLKPVALVATNGRPGEFNELLQRYSYLKDEGWDLRASTNASGGIFPLPLVFPAVDLLITGAGYGAFWESRFFNMESVFVPQIRAHENQQARINFSSDYTFNENGADTFVQYILG